MNKPNVRMISIDVFAIKKRKTYGTMMIDIEINKIINIIESRNTKVVAHWPSTFPNLQLVSHDKAITYKNAITESHPNAIQVINSFYLLQKLTNYLE